MPDTNMDRPELLLRFSRRSMYLTLVFVLAMGTIAIALAISPHGAVSRLLTGAPWMIPFTIILVAGVMQAMMRGHRWNPDSSEVQAIMHDEFRRGNMDRAMRTTFVTLLIAQLPLALLFSALPSLRALLAMAAANLTIGLALLSALFLFFDRD